MLNSLKVKNFRMLADVEISKLGKVNLIVGKNNSGKSTVLEAIRIFASRGNPRVLYEISRSHDEFNSAISYATESMSVSQIEEPPFSDFFSGRQFPSDGAGIYIGDVEEKQFVKINHTFFVEEYEKQTLPSGGEASAKVRRNISKEELNKQYAENDVLEVAQALTVSINDVQHKVWIPLDEIDLSSRIAPTGLAWARSIKEIPVSYVPTKFLSIDYLAKLWDAALFSPHAEQIKAFLKLLDSQFEDLAFVNTGRSELRAGPLSNVGRIRMPVSERTAVIKLKSSPKAIPLASMGDGMLRVLQLALTIAPGKGGFLLIDEFENGLHWSVQEKIWTMIFELATQLDIQVFATTHSEDAVKAFSKVANARAEEGVLLKMVSKTLADGTGKTMGIVYDEATLEAATLTETEIR